MTVYVIIFVVKVCCMWEDDDEGKGEGGPGAGT